MRLRLLVLLTALAPHPGPISTLDATVRGR